LRVPSTPSASLSRLSLHDALPILLVLWRRKYRLHRGRIYLAQTGEGFVYTFLLIGKMRKIIHVLPFAPTTHAKMITKRCYPMRRDRKSTRLNSSHVKISYAVFCLK